MEPKANMKPYISALGNVDLEALDLVAESLHNTVEDGGRIFVAGNGGSHSIAQHFASDLMKSVGGRYLEVSVRCLSDNVALMTALANDIGFESIFAMQVESVELNGKDLVLAFSVSGTSPNIQEMLKVSYERGAKCFLIAGESYQSCKSIGAGHWLVKDSYIGVPAGFPSGFAQHYYVCESVFSAISHEIARLFHIKRGNYSA